MAQLLWTSGFCPSLCHSWGLWLSVICAAPPCLLCCCCCSSSSSLSSSCPLLTLPVWGCGRADCLTAPSGEGSFLFPLPTAAHSSSWGRPRCLGESTESLDLQDGSGARAGRGSARCGALVMCMSPAWSVETVPPGLRAAEEDEGGGCPDWDWLWSCGGADVGQFAWKRQQSCERCTHTGRKSRQSRWVIAAAAAAGQTRCTSWASKGSLSLQPAAAHIAKPCQSRSSPTLTCPKVTHLNQPGILC